MKKLIVVLLLVSMATGAMAADYGYLTLKLQDGTEQSLVSDGLKISFTDGCLVATATDGTVYSVEQSKLYSMYFSDSSVTAITNVGASTPVSVTANNGTLYVAAAKGSKVSVYSVSGALVGRATLSSTTAEAVGNALPSGVYLVKIGDLTTKICVK